MTGKLILDAVGGISDRYVMEFAEVMLKKRFRWKPVALAACLCLVLTAALLWSNEIHQQTTPTIAHGNVIWGDSYTDMSLGTFDHVLAGEIWFSEGLTAAFARSDNPADVFAIRVIEVTGAPDEEVYEQFIETLGLEEEYLSSGVVFATQEQAKEILCPKEFGFVFLLAAKTIEPILINENYLETMGNESIPVVIYIRSSCVPEVEYLPDLERIEAAYLAVMRAVISDYDISEQQVKSLDPGHSHFFATLDKDTLSSLLRDERVSCIWHEDSLTECIDFEKA